jgi:3-oxoadipate enol-lactonase
MTMRRASVNGVALAYDVRGSGPPLVLIMGYRLSSAAWPAEFVTPLSKQFTLLLFDNRGTGLSDKPTSGYALSNMANDVIGLMDHLDIPRANVVGYSMEERSLRRSSVVIPTGYCRSSWWRLFPVDQGRSMRDRP